MKVVKMWKVYKWKTVAVFPKTHYSPNDLYSSQNAMRGVTWHYICTLKIKLYIKDNP